MVFNTNRRSSTYFGMGNDGKYYSAKLKMRILNTKSRMNLTAPNLLVKSILNKVRFEEDYKAFQKIAYKNNLLLKTLNRVSRLNGSLYNFGKPLHEYRGRILPTIVKSLKELDSKNFKLGCKILAVKSSNYYPKRLDSVQSSNLKPPPAVPHAVVDKFDNVFGPEEPITINELLRPRIYMDFESEGRVLGRIIVQLFVEACPEVCLHFIRMCTYKKLDQFQVVRIFPDLWTEAEISVDPKTLYPPKFEYSMNAINQGEHAGVFSFSKNYIDGFPEGLINFSMSFRNMSACNGKRVPFALIVRGLKTLKGMQDFGSKLGKIKKSVDLVNCGVFQN